MEFLAVCPLVFVLPALILALVALNRTRDLGRLRARVEDLEDAVARLRRAARAHAPPAPAERPEAVTAAEPVPTAELAPPEPDPPPARPARPPRPAPRPWAPADAANLEDWVGRKGLGWAAVVVLLFATAFFLKYAFDNAWIGELGRVSMGMLGGAALCVGGLAAHRRGQHLFSQMLTAGGAVLLYLTTFSAFGYYHLLPQDRAAFFLIAVVAETAALAVLYEAPAIALMAVVGGLLSPVLLASDRDQYRSLFTYLAVLDAGVVALAVFRSWRFIAPVALLGTQGLFWMWYDVHYHPEKLAAALAFQGVVFALFLAHDVLAPVLRRRAAPVESLVEVVVNASLFAAAGYVLLREDYQAWMGTLCVGMATLYAALGWLVLRRRPEDPRLVLTVAATALAFVAMTLPAQEERGWVAVGWAAEGAALWWFALRVRTDPLRVLAGVLLVLAVGWLVLADTPWQRHEPFLPVLNKYALPGLAVAACVLAAAEVSRRAGGRPDSLDGVARWVGGLGGVLLVWWVLSFEVYQFVDTVLAPSEAGGRVRRAPQMSLSVFWAVYAAAVLAAGFAAHSRPVRLTALGLFGLTLAKVFLFDMAGLPDFYRVAAFFALAVTMGAAAWGYQRLERPRGAEAEVSFNEK
jgi:uncharacterized membrane protein